MKRSEKAPVAAGDLAAPAESGAGRRLDATIPVRIVPRPATSDKA